MNLHKETPKYLTIRDRFIVLAIYVVVLYLIYVALNGTWIPSESGTGLWFASALGYISFALLDAPFFVKPNDTLASSIAGLVLLISIDLTGIAVGGEALNTFRWISVLLIIFLIVSSGIVLLTQNLDPTSNPKYAALGKASYIFSTQFGVPAIIFTPPALIGIYGFYQTQLPQMLWLGFLWIVLVVVRPIELFWQIGKTFRASFGDLKEDTQVVGKIIRVDSPNIVRVAIEPERHWHTDSVQVACLADSKQVYVLPLFSQIREDGLVGTGLCMETSNIIINEASPGVVYLTVPSPIEKSDMVMQLAGVEEEVDLVGFVVENSTISSINFELSAQTPIAEGHMVFCCQGDDTVYYQILDAHTFEESFERNPRGSHVVTASQVGILDLTNGFKKYSWLPSMNTPVFLPRGSIRVKPEESRSEDLVLGVLPGSEVSVTASFDDMLEFHTAILGVTGMGKTELAFDIIRHGLNQGVKVFCVDFTGDYRARLADRNPVDLGLREDEIEELSKLVFGVETGEYGAGKEKKKLDNYITVIQPDIKKRLEEFLTSPGSNLGVFELPDIANTAATLRATELYLSTLFNWARNNRNANKILLVLEEAHTVVPEFNLYSQDKANTRAIVGRMSQIALQGRKYGVGILLVSQRTALVSKTLLSQCNTYISFSLVDQTSLDYLSNVYSSEHVRTIPRLAMRQALVFGKGIFSERPVIIEIPYDPCKKEASEKIDTTKPSSTSSRPTEQEDDIPF